MEFQKVINKRKMIRSFKDKTIPKAKLDRILNNMFRGPSAGFSQGIEVIVLQDQNGKELFYDHRQYIAKTILENGENLNDFRSNILSLFS